MCTPCIYLSKTASAAISSWQKPGPYTCTPCQTSLTELEYSSTANYTGSMYDMETTAIYMYTLNNHADTCASSTVCGLSSHKPPCKLSL